ncbi:MAG: PilZ domain-containing protein [Phycisphaeraceae bacterium]
MQDPAPGTDPAAPLARIAEHRAQPRLKVPAMYTLLRARLTGDERYRWTGYIYDISLDGMRFELDEAVEPGTELEFRAMLPGQSQVMFRAAGRIVRLHDHEPDERTQGPVRMGMHFDRFVSLIDHRRLRDYLTDRMFASRPTRRAA